MKRGKDQRVSEKRLGIKSFSDQREAYTAALARWLEQAQVDLKWGRDEDHRTMGRKRKGKIEG